MMPWIIETLIATTLLMLLVLAVRVPVARHFGPRIVYLLWLLPALRMVLPPLPEGWTNPGAGAVNETFTGAVQDVVVILAETSSPSAAGTATAAGGIAWLDASAALWLGGAALFFGWHILAYMRFARRTRNEAATLHYEDAIEIAASRRVTSPVAFGIFGRNVVVPADFTERYDATEQRLALKHEVTHHRRGDLRVNLFALGILAVHWFNPIAHFAYRAFRSDQEAACDAIVLDGATTHERHAYGSALFKSVTAGVPIAACAMSKRSGLKRRLRAIVALQNVRGHARTGTAVAGAIVVAGLAVTASSGVAARAVAEVEERAPMLALGGVELAAVDAKGAREAAEAARVNADAAKAHAERARREAEAATPEERAAAWEAADDAREAAEDARRDAADAMSDAADALRDIDEARRDAAEERREALEEAREAVAEARAATRRAGRCPDGKTMHSSIQKVHGTDGHAMRIMMCGKTIYDAKKMRGEMIKGLKDARANLARDKELSERMREQIVAMLDRQIVQWERNEFHKPLVLPGMMMVPRAPLAPVAPTPALPAVPPTPPSPPAAPDVPMQ